MKLLAELRRRNVIRTRHRDTQIQPAENFDRIKRIALGTFGLSPGSNGAGS